MKPYKYQIIKKAIENFKYEGYGYPEWLESGTCTWDGRDDFYNLTENDMRKLIEAGSLSYVMVEGRYCPRTVLENDSQTWLV